MIQYLFFILGFVFLLKGADFLVDGASSIAKRLGVAPIIIGLTLVAFGTSFPELVVNIFSAPTSNEIPVGNILGSSIANILLILGLAALLKPIEIPKNTIWKEIPFSLIAVVVVAIMANDMLLAGQQSVLTRGDGLILLLFFLLFLYYVHNLIKDRGFFHEEEPLKKGKQIAIVRKIKFLAGKLLPRKLKGGAKPLEKQIEIKKYSLSASLAMVFVGLIGLVLGGQWVVEGAVFLARQFGVSEALIALTIISIGTSLPELATSVVAVRKERFEIAVGNIVGSNIFNVFFVLGISTLIRPLLFAGFLNADIFVVVGSTVLLFLFMFLGKRNFLDRWQGFSFVLFYIAYLVFLVWRG